MNQSYICTKFWSLLSTLSLSLPRAPSFSSLSYFLAFAAMFLNDKRLILPFLTDQFRHRLLTSCSLWHMRIVLSLHWLPVSTCQGLCWISSLNPFRITVTYTNHINGLSSPQVSEWVGQAGEGRESEHRYLCLQLPPCQETAGAWALTAVRHPLHFALSSFSQWLPTWLLR